LELEEARIHLWPHAAFHAPEFFQFAAAAIIIAKALQRSIAGIIFQDFIFNIKHHFFHTVPRYPIVRPPLGVSAVNKRGSSFERCAFPIVERPVHALVLLGTVVQLLACAALQRRRYAANAATPLPAVKRLLAFRVLWV
jgi:hypothetical protein